MTCTTEEEYEFEDFDLMQNDEDDDLISNASSTHGSIRSSNSMICDNQDDVDEWEDLNEEERNVRHSESLKQLGNVAKKPMSPLILKDMLGVDGDLALKDIKKIREKTLAKEKRRLDTIYVAVKYFDAKMSERRKLLADGIKKSKSNTFSRRKYWWREKYRCRRKAFIDNSN